MFLDTPKDSSLNGYLEVTDSSFLEGTRRLSNGYTEVMGSSLLKEH